MARKYLIRRRHKVSCSSRRLLCRNPASAGEQKPEWNVWVAPGCSFRFVLSTPVCLAARCPTEVLVELQWEGVKWDVLNVNWLVGIEMQTERCSGKKDVATGKNGTKGQTERSFCLKLIYTHTSTWSVNTSFFIRLVCCWLPETASQPVGTRVELHCTWTRWLSITAKWINNFLFCFRLHHFALTGFKTWICSPIMLMSLFLFVTIKDFFFVSL